MEEDIKYLDHEVVINLIDSIPKDRDKLIFYLMYAYGLRVTELINLSLNDIDLERKTIKILPLKRKDKNKQQFPMSDSSVALIRKWLSERPECDCTNLIVTKSSQKGSVIFKPMSAVNIFKLFRRYSRLAGIDERLRHPHTLRHSYAVSMADNDYPMEVAKEQLRHVSINSTAVYYKIKNTKRDAKTIEVHHSLGL